MLKSRHIHGMNAGKLIFTGLHNCTGAEVVKFSSIKTWLTNWSPSPSLKEQPISASADVLRILLRLEMSTRRCRMIRLPGWPAMLQEDRVTIPWPGYFWEIINKISAESEEVCYYLPCSYFPFYLASMLIHISCNFWMFCFKSFSRVITWIYLLCCERCTKIFLRCSI